MKEGRLIGNVSSKDSAQQEGQHIHDSDRFLHMDVEAKWRTQWYNDNLYRANDDSEKPKHYVLDMYPYPSGSGLHVGHVEGYTATDISSRYMRMQGHEVLHPMGWDAFGLPTENYAIKTGRDPHEVTNENIATFKEQCAEMGLGIDWRREIDTSKESFYKWTQWIFLELYKSNLAYKAEAPTNWCIGCQTVIANEQVIDGKCERCDSSVESRNIEQWYFRTTAYADELIDGLKNLDWPESTKQGQINWIGKTQGYEIDLNLGNDTALPVFTQNPENLLGATFIAVAPEYPGLSALVSENQMEPVAKYTSSILPQGDIERKKKKREKTGVFTGSYVTNPITQESMPIWISDYVLIDTDNGITLGVPAENEVDRDFASKFGLEIRDFAETNGGTSTEKRILFGEYHGMTISEARASILSRLDKKTADVTKYKLRDWLVSRERYWGAPIPIINCDSCGEQPVPVEDLPVLLPADIDDYRPFGVPPLEKSADFMHTTCPNCHSEATREAKTLDTFVDSSWYFLRFTDPNNKSEFASQEALKTWMPIDHYVGGTEHTVGHLLYARFMTKALNELGHLPFNEPFTSLRHPGIVLGEDRRKMSKRWGNVINPGDVSNEHGSDALRMYEMFMGPLDQVKSWDSQAIVGVRKFIDRVWRLQYRIDENEPDNKSALAHNRLITSVENSIQTGKYNLAISEFMKYINTIGKNTPINRGHYENFLKSLAPFAPFLTEEIWEKLGNEYSIHQQGWPAELKVDKLENERKIPLQINGKSKGMITINGNFSGNQEELRSILENDQLLRDKIDFDSIKKIIYIPGKIINIVI